MKLHFIGIGGSGMGALARLLKEAGHDVRGSDSGIYPPMSVQLADAGIEVFPAYDAANLAWGPECVVVGNVCKADHPEVLAANDLALPYESFPSMLARSLLAGRDALVVAGTHGKTTTTSLLAWLLTSAGRDPSFLIGGVPLNLGTGAHLGSGTSFVIEGDEYDTAFFDKRSKFLHYRPQRAVLTSVEYDHVDIFPDFESMRATFVEFVQTLAPAADLIVNRDDSEAMGVAAAASCNVLTYRVLPTGDEALDSADYCARVVPGNARRTRFEVFERGESLGGFSTQLVGRYNVGNLLAAIAVCRREGVSASALQTGVQNFRGVRRRQELLGMAAGVRIIADFAHHPTAAQLTVTAIRKRYPDKALHVCFEPRSSSSRRRQFAEAYAASFDAASAVYIAPVFRPEKVPAGECLDTAGLAKAIASRGGSARAFPSVDALCEAVLDRAVPGDSVLLLSSGSFEGLGESLLFGFGDPVSFATAADAAAVGDLMDGYGLPPVVAGPEVETMVMRSPNGVVGCVSLQVVGSVGFLFGLAVAPPRRGQGLGWVLGDIVLRRARMLGVRQCYLITNTATDFFAGKLGFSPIAEEEIDPAIVGTANFAISARLSGAVCMVLSIPADGPLR